MTKVEVSITQGGGFCARLVFMLGYPTEDNRIQPHRNFTFSVAPCHFSWSS